MFSWPNIRSDERITSADAFHGVTYQPLLIIASNDQNNKAEERRAEGDEETWQSTHVLCGVQKASSFVARLI